MNTPDRPQDEQPIGDEPTSDECLSAYLDNELSEADRGALEAQLAQNPELRETLAELGMLSQMLQALPKQSLPSQFSERVLRRAERQMLLGEPVEQEKDTSSDGTPTEISTMKSHDVRRFWWIPAALAAVLAGVLIIPSLVRRADVAQVNMVPEPTRESADKLADTTEARVTESNEGANAERFFGQEGVVKMEEEPVERPPPTAVVGPTAAADADGMRDEEFAIEADVAAKRAGEVAMTQPKPTARDLGDEMESLREKADDGAEFRSAAVKSREQELATTDWQYDQDSPLVEVQLPIAVAGRMATRARRGVGATEGLSDSPIADARSAAVNAGQLYGVQGSPTELGKLIGEFKRQGAVVQDHDLPNELRMQLAKQQTPAWIDRSVADRADAQSGGDLAAGANAVATSRLGMQIERLGRAEPIQQLFESPELEITLLEPPDSDALARMAERHVRRDGRQQLSPLWLRQALGRDADHENLAMEEPSEVQSQGGLSGRESGRASLSEEGSQRLNGQLGRDLNAMAGGRLAERMEAEPQRVQLYLWLRDQPQLELESEGTEQPPGSSDGN